MKKAMKAKRPPADPMGHPPVLDIKPDLSKPTVHLPEPHKHSGRKGQKGSR